MSLEKFVAKHFGREPLTYGEIDRRERIALTIVRAAIFLGAGLFFGLVSGLEWAVGEDKAILIMRMLFIIGLCYAFYAQFIRRN